MPGFSSDRVMTELIQYCLLLTLLLTGLLARNLEGIESSESISAGVSVP